MRFFPHSLDGKGQWAITEQWKETDVRRQRIQRSELAADMDFDVIGFAPIEMTVDDAQGFLLNAIRKAPKSRDELDALLSRVRHFNAAQKEKNVAPVKEFMAEIFDANKATAGTRFTIGPAGASSRKMRLNKEEKAAQRELAGG